MTYRHRDCHVEAWQFEPGQTPPPELNCTILEPIGEPGEPLVSDNADRNHQRRALRPGDWIVRDLQADTLLRVLSSVDMLEQYALEADLPAGHAGDAQAHRKAREIIGRLVGILHAEHTRYDVDRDLHALVAYLDRLDRAAHAGRQAARPLATLYDILRPSLVAGLPDVHPNTRLIVLTETPAGEPVQWSIAVAELQAAKNLVDGPTPMPPLADPLHDGRRPDGDAEAPPPEVHPLQEATPDQPQETPDADR